VRRIALKEMHAMRIMSPTGHLGFTPIEPGSFEAGVATRPDAIVADSGSADMGPYPLGSDAGASPAEWQAHDLELCLLAARRLGVPLVIGSAGDTGSDRMVQSYLEMLEEIATRHQLGPIPTAAIRTELSIDHLSELVADGARLEGLGGRDEADGNDLARTDRAVAVMGVEPIAEALQAGAEVIVCGRSSDSAIFAAVGEVLGGHERGVALLAGKLLECASFCAEPFMGKESVIGELDAEGVTVEPMHPQQRCTPLSLASHVMYERANPFYELVPGGTLDMTGLQFDVVDERRTRVSGGVWRPSDTHGVKIEGAGTTGERALAIVGVRDPYTLSRLDDVIAWSRDKLAERFGKPADAGYEIYFHVYGRDGVMGELEPTPEITGHEVGIVTEVVAKTAEMARELCTLGTRNLFYARLPDVKGTAGGAAFFSDEVLDARPAYEWTLNHVLVLGDGEQGAARAAELFRTEHLTIGS
jgi:hypothetical protein